MVLAALRAVGNAAAARSNVRFGSKADVRVWSAACALYPRKRTSLLIGLTSALRQKETSAELLAGESINQSSCIT
jgi:hypothetical protein